MSHLAGTPVLHSQHGLLHGASFTFPLIRVCRRPTSCGSSGALHNSLPAAAEGVLIAEGVAHVRARIDATAYTADRTFSTDWLLETSAQQHHAAQLHKHHRAKHVQLQHTCSVVAEKVERSWHQDAEQANPPASGVLLAEQTTQQRHQGHTAAPQTSSATCSAIEPDLLAGGVVAAQKQPQQPRQSHRAEHRLQLSKQRMLKVPRTSTVKVANTTNADGLAEYLVNNLELQLKQHKQYMSRHGVHAVHHDSSNRVVMYCASSLSVLTALQAIVLAAHKAAVLLGQPYQLLMQPQLVHNALASTADGGHSAGAYQLHLFWVPTAAVTHKAQQVKQPTASESKYGRSRVEQQQQEPHQSTPQPNRRRPVQRLAVSSNQAQQPDTTALTPPPVVLPAAHSDGLSARAEHLQALDCDPPQQVPKQHKRRRKGVSSDLAHSNRASQQHLVLASALSWQVSGLLRGGWPAQLRCSLAAGALTAVRALVKARQQLAASDSDLLVMVQAEAERAAPDCVAGSSAAEDAKGPIMLWAVSCARAPDGLGPAAHTQARVSSNAHRADVVAMSAVEQHLRQQFQHRRRRKQCSACSQQQRAMGVGLSASAVQQHQSTAEQRQQQQHQLEQQHQLSWPPHIQKSHQTFSRCPADMHLMTMQLEADDVQQHCHLTQTCLKSQQQLEQQQQQSMLSGGSQYIPVDGADKPHETALEGSVCTHIIQQQRVQPSQTKVALAIYVS